MTLEEGIFLYIITRLLSGKPYFLAHTKVLLNPHPPMHPYAPHLVSIRKFTNFSALRGTLVAKVEKRNGNSSGRH